MKGLEWSWTKVEQRAFEVLKSKLLKSPVPVLPDPTKPYVLRTDASDVGIGAVLSQEDDEGRLRLARIACRSKKLSPPQTRYTVHEKEMLSLIEALEVWRHYLLGAEVKVYTDNSALK